MTGSRVKRNDYGFYVSRGTMKYIGECSSTWAPRPPLDGQNEGNGDQEQSGTKV